MSFKPGDKVRYIGKSSNWARLKGKTGTVLRCESYEICIKWDDPNTYPGTTSNPGFTWAPRSFEHFTAEEDAIALAIATLKKYGEVVFKPAFKPIKVNLNHVHDATVHEDHVTVGCQTFQFERILALADVIKNLKAK